MSPRLLFIIALYQFLFHLIFPLLSIIPTIFFLTKAVAKKAMENYNV